MAIKMKLSLRQEGKKPDEHAERRIGMMLKNRDDSL